MPQKRPTDEEVQGMTVNERLFACGLMDAFDRAILKKSREEAMAVLAQCAMTEHQAAYTVDMRLKNPQFYGY